MSPAKRSRARKLTSDAFQKLHSSIREWELNENAGYKIAQKTLTEITGLDAKTVKKVLENEGCDKRILRKFFMLFGLELTDNDHIPASHIRETHIDPSFVGRESAIADLDELVKKNTKVIVIQAQGGAGKTTLAKKYLQQRFESKNILEFRIAREEKDIASVESLVEEKLRLLGEEPSQDFFVSLDRLKLKLQSACFGILIDNLEPALDKAGKFIERHRRYFELLRVLSDPFVESTTLITSRERLSKSSIEIYNYSLKNLDVSDWESIFKAQMLLIDSKSVKALHKAYGGNAKAMKIISSAILEDFEGDVKAYWQSYQHDLLIERDLEDLVKQQFERLNNLDLNAYKLLCRMGCYRYQDIKNVSIEGLTCLLWDIQDGLHQKRIIKSLKNRSLIEFEDQKYFLHPVIRAEAISRLRSSSDWNESNSHAAEYWKVDKIENMEDGLKILESYYHYSEVENWNKAFEILLTGTGDCENATFFYSQIRNMYLKKCISIANNLIQKISFLDDLKQSVIYALVADINAINGDMENAIKNYNAAILLFQKIPFPKKNGQPWEDHEVDIQGALAMTYLYMGEYQKSIKLFEDGISLANKLGHLGKKFAAYIHCCLSLAYIYIEKNRESKSSADTAYCLIGDLDKSNYHWIKTHGYYSLGMSFLTHNEKEKSREMQDKLISYSNQTSNLQAKGLAFLLLGAIKAKEERYKEAILIYKKANFLFEEIGAMPNLAEGYYWIGLAYKAMGNTKYSNSCFQQSMRLFNLIKAPQKAKEVSFSIELLGSDC